jgi:hypothetical protein
MYAEVLRATAGVAIFPVMSLVLFVVLFSAVLIWVARLDRGRLDRLARLPLEEGRHESETRRRRDEGVEP